MHFANKTVFSVLLLGLLYFPSSYSFASLIITTSDIEWTPAEPRRLEKQQAYKKWKKDFWILSKKEAKRLGISEHSLRHSEIDVDNDGVKEILVQDTTWYSGGFGIGLFQKKGHSWKLISQHRGAFVLINKYNQRLELLLIERSGLDYTSFAMKYNLGKYHLVKSSDCAIGFNRFWELNWSKQENLQSRRRDFQPEEDPPVPRPRPPCIAGEKTHN